MKAKIALLRVLEETSMCLELSFRDAYSIGLTAVKPCSKSFFGLLSGHGKSPCFLRCGFSAVVGVGYAVSVFASNNVADFLDCA